MAKINIKKTTYIILRNPFDIYTTYKNSWKFRGGVFFFNIYKYYNGWKTNEICCLTTPLMEMPMIIKEVLQNQCKSSLINLL